MKITQLKRYILYRKTLMSLMGHYSESETNILICIYIMNGQGQRCSCNTLFTYLSNYRRTPYRKKLLSTVRKLKIDGMIRTFGKGNGTNMVITMDGKLHLDKLDKKLKEARVV